MRPIIRSVLATLAAVAAILLAAAPSSAAWPVRDCGSEKGTYIETARRMTCAEERRVFNHVWAKMWFGPNPASESGPDRTHHYRVHATIRGLITHFRCRVWYPAPGFHLHLRCADRHGDVLFYRQMLDPV